MALEQYYLAESLDEVLSLMARDGEGSLLMAGGTDLMVSLRAGALKTGAKSIIDVHRVPELKTLRIRDGYVEIGAAVTHADIAAHAGVAAASLLLHVACGSVGSPQIRNRGTLGGNIVTAAQCADTIPALLVLDAEVRLRSASGKERVLPVRDFFPGPKKTSLGSDEVLVSVRFPSLEGTGRRGYFYKLIRRAAVAKSRLNIALLFKKDGDGRIADARISIGSTLPVPGRFTSVEELLTGEIPTDELLEDAAAACSDFMIRIAGHRWSTEYKEPAVRGMAKRGFEEILKDGEGHDR